MRREWIVAVLLVAGGCRTYHVHYQVGSADYELARRVEADGRVESYRLEVRGEAHLRVLTEYDRERPFLGFQLAVLDAPAAERRRVQPYTGLLVRGVYPGSSAAAADVRAGDVLLSLDGRATIEVAQVYAIERQLAVGQRVAAQVLRDGERLDFQLASQRIRERVTDEQSIPLEAPALLHRPYAGASLLGIPAVWCERVFGSRRQAVVVTSIEVGSPAWLAGMRGGDVIETVDGAPVPPVAELSARIAERGAAGQPMQFVVRRGSNPVHMADVQLGDYSGERTLWVPLVLRIEDGTYEDTWTLGPFGLLLSNRNHYLANTQSRVVEKRNVFAALFGLVQVTTTPTESAVRLFWFLSL